MRLATSGATRWLIAPLSARDTVEGCTPHFSATSLIVGRDEAAGFVAFPVTILLLCTIHGIPSSRETANRPDSSLTVILNIPKRLIAIDCNRLHKPQIGHPHECFERADAASDPPRASRSELALGSGDPVARPHVGRFRAPDRFRSLAPLPAGACPQRLEGLALRRAAAVRRQQHPLRH